MTEVERYRGSGLDVDTLREQFAPKATDLELRHFVLVCGHLDLDPYAGHIHLIGRWDGKAGKLVHRPQIAVAGRRAIAARTGLLAGVDGPYWCGPRKVDAHGVKLPLEWLDVWDDDDAYPYAARALVWVADWRTPANGTVKWSEFAQYTDAEQTKLSPFWKRSPSHMLGKVAEALALRRGFPEVNAAVAYIDAQGNFEADDAGIAVEAATDVAPAGPGVLSPNRGPAPGPAHYDRVPDSVYDDLPEAQGGSR